MGRERRPPKTAVVGNPFIGNSLLALVMAMLHAPPMLALLWTQRWLRRRLRGRVRAIS
jgi:hypothetical protein